MQTVNFAVGRSLKSEVVLDRFFESLWRQDPDEVLRKAGLRRENLRALEGDDEIDGACDTRVEAVISTPWRLEPSEGDGPTFLWEQLAPHFEHIIRACWQAVPYGYSVMQIVYSDLGGRVGINYVVEEEFERFIPTHRGELLLYDGTKLEANQINPLQFVLTVRQPSRRNPYGKALFSKLYWPFFFRTHGWRFWLRWLERFGSPFIIGKTVGDVEKMGDSLKEAVNGASIAIANTDDVALAGQTTGSGHFEGFDDVIVRRYQKLILGQTLTTDVGDKGSFAAAKVHNDVREDKRNADIRLVSRSVQEVINRLWMLNGFGGQAPQFVMSDDTGLERERADRDAILSEKLAVEFSDDYLMDQYDLERTDFKRKEPPEMLASKPGQAGGQKPVPVKAEGSGYEFSSQFTPVQEGLEVSLARALVGAPEAPIPIEDLRSAVMAASDQMDLEKRLAMLIDKANPEFEELLARTSFAAQILGFVAAEIETGSVQTAPVAFNAQVKMPEPAPINVTFAPAEQPVINVTVQMPEQPAPVVTVTVPEQAAPQVTVNNTLEVPARTTETTIERDPNGEITRMIQVDKE